MAKRLDPPLPPGQDGTGRAAGLAPRLALLVVTVVFAGFVVNAFQYVVTESATFTHVTPAVAVLAVMMVLQLGFFSNPAADVRGWRGYAALLVQAALVLVPIAFYAEGWTGMPGFLAGDALLVLRAAAGWLVFGAVVLANGVIQFGLIGTVLDMVYIATLTAVIGLVVYGLSRLRSLVKDLDAARSELAGLAVARERLRFARDLHDLLGFSLSAVTLKAELAHRLVPVRPEQARRELSEILAISRQALADVRTVASSYRELSLNDELTSARSVLTAAEVDVSTTFVSGDLPAQVRTALATVLREGVTNLLRHSKAEHCSITVSRDEGSVSIEIVNDGVRDPDELASPAEDGRGQRRPGNGIGNLTNRVEALGGTLTAATEGETHRLHATLPLPDEDDDGQTSDSRGERPERMPAIVPRFGMVIASAVFLGYAATATIFVFNAGLGLGGTLVAEACVLVAVGLVLGFFSRPDANLHSPPGYALLAGQAVVSCLPIVLFDDPYLGLPGLLAGSVLLVLPGRAGIPLFLLIAVAASGAHLISGSDSINVTFGFLVTVNQGLVVFALSRLRSMVKDLHDARSELADLAVTDERLRFARDLHDLLGYSLSAITLKSELTHRLVTRDCARAQEELSGILDISRQALTDVRSVASSYRALSLDEEIASARSLLAAANIDVTIRLDPCELTPDVRTALATVLREGVTNLLRHSKAANCEITLTRDVDRLTLEIVNDGILRGGTARPGAAAVTGGGAGIRNLATRLTNVGGTLLAGATSNDTYRLRAEVPLSTTDDQLRA